MHFLKQIIITILLTCPISFFGQEKSIKLYNSENGLTSENVKFIVQDHIGYLWLGTEDGLFKFDGDDFKKLNSYNITALFLKKKKLYIGLENGLLIRENNKETFLECKSITKIINEKGNIYVATDQGIYFLNVDYLEPLRITTKIDFSIIYDIVYTKELFYVATNKGLFEIDNLKSPKKINLIQSDIFLDLEVFNNSILAANRSKLKSISNKQINNLEAIPNISNLKKIDNKLWVTSFTEGIEIFTLPSFTFDRKINKYNSFTTNYVNTVNQSLNGFLWFGTDKGLIQLSTNKTIKKKRPEVFFESVNVDFQDKSEYLDKHFYLKSNENSIIITYKTVDLNNPKDIYYRYKINDKYSNWSNNNSLQLASLAYGEHKILIQSKVGNKVSDPKQINFTIATPFYYNFYFIIIVFLLILITAYLIIERNIKVIEAKNKKRIDTLKIENTLLTLKQKALQLQMNPHFIFNVLNNIKALGNSNQKNDLNTVITEFSSLLRSLLHHSKKEEISLQEEITSIKNYLNLEKRISSKNFDYQIDCKTEGIEIDEIMIPTMLLQPFIENSIKHGFSVNKKGLLKVNIYKNNTFLHVEIIDDGKGFNSKKSNSSEKNNSLAIAITKERLNSITKKNVFEISEIKHNNTVTGTKVSFKIPFIVDF